MAVTELQLQRLALRVGTIADTCDFEHLGEAFGHARDQVLHQRALHTPEGARFTRVVGGLNRNAAFADFIFDVVGKRHRERALRALHRQLAAVDRGGDAAGDRYCLFTNARHQNTSASTSPPTLCSRASAYARTPRGVDTMWMPRPMRTIGRFFEPD